MARRGDGIYLRGLRTRLDALLILGRRRGGVLVVSAVSRRVVRVVVALAGGAWVLWVLIQW
jgi:hypothetical protein